MVRASSQVRSLLRRHGLQLLALLGGVAAMGLAVAMNPQFHHRAMSGPVDLLPLVLGGKAILAGLDPNDPATLEQLYRNSSDINLRVHGFHNYYPPTACMLLLPLTLLPFQLLSDLFYWGGMAALVGAAWFIAGAGRPRGALSTLGVALAVGSVFLQLRLARVVLPSGQVSPFIVLLAAMALWGLARPQSKLGPAVFAVGVAIKYFPLVLLPAALAARRWRWLAATALVAVAFGACMWVWRDGTGGWDPKWVFGVSNFVTASPLGHWVDHGPPWLMWLWKGRLPGIGTATLILVGLAAWRRPGRELTVACGGLMLAWGGVSMTGGHFYHESIMILPALGFVLCWPAVRGPRALQWSSALIAVAVLFAFQAFARDLPRNPPHWLPMSYVVWILCAVRWGWAVWWERRNQTGNNSASSS